jgi:predicted PurR-regulated permease PerM
MRDLILGVFLGVLLTVLPDWMEKHNMDNYVDVAMIIVIVGIFLLVIWRPVLKLIYKYNFGNCLA